MTHWSDTLYWNNSLRDYLVALLIIIIGLVAVKLLRSIVLGRVRRWARNTSSTLDDFILKLMEKAVLPALYLAVIYGGIRTLNLSATVENVLRIAIVVVLTFFGIRLVVSALEYGLNSYLSKEKKGGERRKELRGMLIIINVILWSVGIIFLFDNLGFDVTTVLTGLGIGGIAIALAAQTILGDLFAYFVIFFDRPFEIGDFIIVEDKLGSIEHIGVKTTRIRSLWGEELIYSNKLLTDSWIHNYKRMERRRIVFQLDISYLTPADKLEQIPARIRRIIESQERVQFDRAHFASYTEFSLKFEVVYYVLTSDYNVYMDIQQAINLALFREFAAEGIRFAHPLRSLVTPDPVTGQPRPLTVELKAERVS
ncbi:mechanosensitive ion channel family protein [Compostibacter hankyongensis]|uniref:Mechanosensitive ion channel family protein n=1 Tax=Compostibacter hankyongensis TaxID=1007089 RepID=A0ABP8FEX7_9BACT